MRIDLAKLLPETCKKNRIQEIVINTLDISRINAADSENEISFIVGNNLKINVAPEDKMKYEELCNYYMVEQTYKLVDLSNLLGIDYINLHEDGSRFESNLKFVQNSFQKKYACDM